MVTCCRQGMHLLGASYTDPEVSVVCCVLQATVKALQQVCHPNQKQGAVKQPISRRDKRGRGV